MIALMQGVFDAILLGIPMVLLEKDQGVRRGQPVEFTGVGMISQGVEFLQGLRGLSLATR